MATTMRASTPVSWAGRTTWPGTAAWPVRPSSLYQCTRNRFRGSASSAAVPASDCRIPAGMLPGAASWPNVGSRMPASRNRPTVRPYTSWSTTFCSSPSDATVRPPLPAYAATLTAPGRGSAGAPAGEQVVRPEREPPLGQMLGAGQAPGGDLLDLPYPVPQRLLVDVQLRGG